jgi:hypothetical protein
MVASFSAHAPKQSKYVNPAIKIYEILAPYLLSRLREGAIR